MPATMYNNSKVSQMGHLMMLRREQTRKKRSGERKRMAENEPRTAKAAAATQLAGDAAAAPYPAPADGADDLTAALSALFLFNGLTAEEKAVLIRAGQIRRQSVARGTTVFDRDRAEQALVLVLDGRLQVLQGRVVMNELCAGQVFGAAALFDTTCGEGGRPYPSTVKAATDARLAFIPQATVTAWMRLCPPVYLIMT